MDDSLPHGEDLENGPPLRETNACRETHSGEVPPVTHHRPDGGVNQHSEPRTCAARNACAKRLERCYDLKMLSGRKAETIQLGASTTSLILRSTATLHRMYASSRLNPNSRPRNAII